MLQEKLLSSLRDQLFQGKTVDIDFSFKVPDLRTYAHVHLQREMRPDLISERNFRLSEIVKTEIQGISSLISPPTGHPSGDPIDENATSAKAQMLQVVTHRAE